jgi:alkylation response protein AidB-like acyl-CoA dehydrogenase
MGNYYLDNDDLQYYVNKAIDWNALIPLVENQFRASDAPKNVEEALEFYRDILQMAGGFIADEVAPKCPLIDRKGMHLENGEVVEPEEFKHIFNTIRELGLPGMTSPRSLGGMNCPVTLYFIMTELFARADVSVMTHFSFHLAVATSLMLYSVNEGSASFNSTTASFDKLRFEDVIKEVIQGKAWGAMDITEPNAGSDMAAIQTLAETNDQGQWFLTGQKIFITSGHGKYHLVIARSEPASDPNHAGLAGLSLFLVKTYEDTDGVRTRYASIDRLEEKLGHHGSATCAISFHKTPAELIGKRGEGFKYMLLLMNNARLGVGFESVGLCEAALRMAKNYAQERKSMGKTLDQHELIADYLDEMQSDIMGLRALAMKGAFHEEMYHRLNMQQILEGHKDDELTQKRRKQDIRAHAHASRKITPLLKYLGAEKAVEISRRTLQIHGGFGYTKEYGAEKLLRDALVAPIYEGTSQIQSLMAMKDTLLGVMRNPQQFVKDIAQTRWRSISSRNPLEKRVAKLQNISLAAIQHLVSKMATDKLKSLSGKPLHTWSESFKSNWDPKKDFSYALLHAERLTRIMADVAVCEVLLEQSLQHPERACVLERYIDRAEPRCRFLLDEITTTGARLLQQLKPQKTTEEKSAQSA